MFMHLFNSSMSIKFSAVAKTHFAFRVHGRGSVQTSTPSSGWIYVWTMDGLNIGQVQDTSM